MQNWNQWQLSAGAVTTSVPQSPVGYAAAGADPMTLMQSYMQYYNQPTPTGYTPEQWAATQQQGWTQWQQWQQQYQQWQAQYGEKYQETMKQFSTQNMNFTGQLQLPNVQAPPLPKEDARPPLPPATTNTYQFTMPPPHQNNLPLFPAKEPASNIVLQPNVTNHPTNPPLPTSQPPLPTEIGETRENILAEKCDNNIISESSGDKKLKLEDDELTKAERTFDEQFKQWEEQFNKWKQQNANHPDKTQYKQYEAKWTSWREKLIERREQMRKKREQQKQAAAKTEAEKNKNISGNDKILNILSNTENQGLINNLLGIGKTLGLTGKQNVTAPLPPPPPPPPPPPENTNSSNQSTSTSTTQVPQQNLMQTNMIRPNVALSWPNQQQWGNQHYNSRMEMPGYGPGMSSMPVPIGISPNFTQPPPSLPPNNITPNFSQPPPNFPNIRPLTLQNVRPSGPTTTKDQSSFGPTNPSTNTDIHFMPNERLIHNFGGQSNFQRDDQERRDTNTNPNLNEQDQFRPIDTFGTRSDFNDRVGGQHFRKGDRNYNDFGNNQLNPQNNFNLSNDRFGSTNSPFGSGNIRFGEDNNRLGSMGNNKFPLGNDRFSSDASRFGNEWVAPDNDRFKSDVGPLGVDKNRRGAGNERFDSNDERFGPGGERFGPTLGIDRFESKDRFFPGNDRFGPNSEPFHSNDRFGRGNNTNYFESKDTVDHRRDNFGPNSRSFNRNAPFSPPNELSPELKKLMEKRKAAGDVFRPSFVDSDKSNTIGSLSESFKKIAGDSPFRSSLDFQKNLPNRSGLMTFPTSGPHSFQPHSSSDSGQVPISTYGSRSHSFNIDSPFKGSMDNFVKHNNPVGCNERQRKDMEIKSDSNQSQSINIQSQAPIKHSENIEAANSDSLLKTDDIASANNAIMMQTNETDNSIKQKDFISEDNLTGNDNVEENKTSDDSLQQNDKGRHDAQTDSNIEERNNDNDKKKSESLPFMGENDPRPEDLNIEPPPELPNLCPISTDSQNMSLSLNDENQKESANNQCNIHFDRSFDSSGIELKSDMPFGSRGPSIIEDNLAASRISGSISDVFQPQGPDTQLNLQDPNNDQCKPSTSTEFNSKKSNDEQCNIRDCNEESPEGIQATNQQFIPRNPVDFGPCLLASGKFGPSDRQIGPRGPTDSFPSRNSGPFGFRSSDMQFRPRGINDCMDFRTIPERTFGSRGPNDILCGPRRPNDMTFNTRRVPEFGLLGSNRFGRPKEPFDKRSSFDNSGLFSFPNERFLSPRRSNEGAPSSHGSSDVAFGSRNPNDAFQNSTKGFNDNRFESRDFNDGLCGSQDFKAKNPMSNVNSPNLSSRIDPFCNDLIRKNPFVRRGQFEDEISKRTKYEEGSNLNEFNKISDRNIDIEVREDNTNDYVRRTSDSYKKKLDDVGHCSRYGFNDNWKDKFGNDQRHDGDQHKDIDKNVSNAFDERTGSDFQSKYNSNLYTNQSKLRNEEEFYVQKQFNYNHGEVDKKFTADCHFSPAKVIDYGHASRSSIDQQLSSLYFDYCHGEFKPTLDLDQQQHHPKQDFRNWVESEQNLKEYTEKMKNYENMKGYTDKTRNYENYYDVRKSDYNIRKEHDWQSKDKKYEEEKKENEDRKERGFNLKERFFERDFSNDQNDRCQSDRNISKEWTQENSRRETNKDNDKDNRSKGSINWQECSNKNIIDTKLQDTSLSSDPKKNVDSKTLELAKIPNYTMVDDLLCPPGRQNRSPKIAIILRGPPGSGKSFVAKLIKDKEVEQGGSAPRILSLDDYFLVEKEVETKDDNGKKVTVKEMVYEYEEAMEPSYVTSLVKAFKKNITDGFFNFIILDCINEKILDYEEMWSFAKSKGFKVYICEMEMDLQICLKRNIHNRTEDEINRIIDYFEPTPSYHQKLDVNSMLQEQAIEEVDMEDSQETEGKSPIQNEDSEDSHEDTQDGISKWEKMEAEDKLDRLDGLARKKNETRPQTMEDFLQVPDYYNMEDTSGKKRVRWADLEERKEQEKMRAVGFVVGHTNWDRMMDPTKGGSALTRTKFFSLS